MIGVAVKDVGPSELSNEAIIRGQTFPITFFYENSVRPIIPPGKPCLNIVDAFTFRGPLLATNLSTATKLLNMPCVGGRFFYVWNLEWLNKPVSYDNLWPYYSPRIKIIARCEDYKIALQNCFNIKVDVMESFEKVYQFMSNAKNESYNTYTLKWETKNLMK